jgi:hypothetical protein
MPGKTAASRSIWSKVITAVQSNYTLEVWRRHFRELPHKKCIEFVSVKISEIASVEAIASLSGCTFVGAT